MDIRLLAGVVEYRGAEGPVRIPGTSARAILAMLALRPAELLLTDEIIEGLWGRRFPHDPTAAVQVTISRLRRALGDDRDQLRTMPLGYLLDIDSSEVDVGRVESAIRRAASLVERGDILSAHALLSAALDEWHCDTPLIEFADLPFGPPASSRLLALRCDLVEACNEAALSLGRPQDVTGRTEAILKSDPWRERLVAQLMRALHQSGRTAEAIAAYATFAATLQTDLNIEPSSELQDLRARLAVRPATQRQAQGVDLRDEALPRWFEAALEELDREEDDPVLRARLQLALGQAEQQAGLPGWAATLRRAGDTARHAGDTNLVARCLLAAAPGWSTSPGAPDAGRLQQMSGLLEDDGLNDDVRSRLLAAYANELSFTAPLDERIVLTDRAVAAAQRSGSPTALLAVLNQRFNAIWAPETHDLRVYEAAQACELAENAGHQAAQAIAEGFAMAVAAESGDIASIDEHLTKFTALAGRLRLPVFEWGAGVHSSWWAALVGDLERSEELAEIAWGIGRRAARPEADIVHTSQVLALRWRQGRLGEELANIEALASYMPLFRAMHANAHLQAGDQTQARRLLTEAWESGTVGSLNHDQLYITTLAQWADVAAGTAARDPARELYSMLLPYERWFAFTGSSVLGPVSGYLAGLADTLGDPGSANGHRAQADRAIRPLQSPTITRTATG